MRGIKGHGYMPQVIPIFWGKDLRPLQPPPSPAYLKLFIAPIPKEVAEIVVFDCKHSSVHSSKTLLVSAVYMKK